MIPIIEVPETIRDGMMNYRNVFCREEGFEHVSRYVTGLIISPNKTARAFSESKQVLEMISSFGQCSEIEYQAQKRDGINPSPTVRRARV